VSKNLAYFWYDLLMKLVLLSISCTLITGASFALSYSEGIQVYQKILPPEHKQKLADDIIRYRHADNLWDILRDEFALPHYENHPAVQEKIVWYMNNQDYLLQVASRAAPYLYYISQQLKKRHLPAELVLLPIIESGYNPFVYSNVGAAGIWQMMPSTASGLGIKQDGWYDGRRDIIASTRAALNYLGYLQSFFDGNWLLALAAYNTGEGNVLAAIKKNIREGKNTSFWSLPVAQQTKDYVPSLLALATIISHPVRYPIHFPSIRNAPYLAQVDIGTQMNLKYAATLAGISHHKLMQLNPGFTRSSMSMKGPHKLVLPIENIEQFTENLAHSPFHYQTHWVHYTTKSGDTLLSIAKKFNTTSIRIRQMNHLSSQTIKPGVHLLIPHTTTQYAARESPTTYLEARENSQLKKKLPVPLKKAFNRYTLQPGDTVYMVRNKDSLDSIAHHFHVSKAMLYIANQLSSTSLEPGRQLIIPTHAKRIETTVKPLSPHDTLYMVQRGDTLEKIAQRFKTTSSVIRLANLLSSGTVQQGDQLIIPAHS
jgi:membrane-bound lytic murein transglycosylase D